MSSLCSPILHQRQLGNKPVLSNTSTIFVKKPHIVDTPTSPTPQKKKKRNGQTVGAPCDGMQADPTSDPTSGSSHSGPS